MVIFYIGLYIGTGDLRMLSGALALFGKDKQKIKEG